MPTTYVYVGSGPVWSQEAKTNRNRGFLAYAIQFRRASDSAESPVVKAYLLGHALELLLKTYLLQHGYGETALKDRKFGHRIKRLLHECRKHDLDAHLDTSAELLADINAFSNVYAGKVLEYFSIIYLVVSPEVPDLSRVAEFTRQLSEHLCGELAPPGP